MKVLLLILSILPWQNMLQEAKQHYMNYENDSCAVKAARVREYCNAHQDETGVLELSADVENVLGALSQLDGQRDSAALHYRNAYDYVMRMEDRSKAPMYCINLADILRQTGKAPEAHPDEKYFIFGKDGGKDMAAELGVELLGQIPLVQGIRESGDAGEPSALSNRPDGLAFVELAGRLAEKLG